MNQIQVEYQTLVDVMQEKLSAQLSQIVALEARVRAYDKALTEALEAQSQTKPQKNRGKSTDMEMSTDSY